MRQFLLCITLLISGCDQSASVDNDWQLNVFDPASNTSRFIQAPDVANKLIIINYWAEWCKPCIAEIPELNRFASDNKAKIFMLGVNFDNKKDAALQEAMHKVSMTFPAIISDPAKVFALPDIAGLPTTLILDEHGILKEQLPGPQTFDSLQSAVNRITKP